ncbi:hypothetical protein FOMG_16829 [Fusarium oxysporum f. sp. melonis 26406]|uniref:Glycosyl hydrolase family 13 catalytic domain-containing protein n=1 Tax=Fusarium oxysporum f. sp. melonis 26406 TaxID=1089452 RepID=W9ZE98_FUSOX|nr:hypothetical protein FOMG_16829 [Fusarium oxysporum f. sp. melonis 26406]
MTKNAYRHEPIWWKQGVVYRIYPASFKDTNGDGIGDIPGIIFKLDYIQDLGVDIIWVSPHYKSPQVDMGYDISDFQDIHEPYGALEDCQRLIQEIHDRGMRVIFDLVINHTSNQHPWFIDSRSSLTNPKRDWYFWRQPKTFDDTTQEYYIHVYASGQQDLNWENEACRREIYDNAIKFWLDRGVDGFRVDTVNKFSKVSGLPDAPIVEPDQETQTAVCHYANGPRIQEYLREMKQVMAPYDIMTVGELPNTSDLEGVLKYISPKSQPGSQKIDMVFNFDTVNLGQTPGNRFLPIPFDNNDFKRCLTKSRKLPETTGAWTTVFLENHDQDIRDCTNHNPAAIEEATKDLQRVARDHARVPMQWDNTPNTGFTNSGAMPWMPVLDNYRKINVSTQPGNKNTVLEYWREILKLRRKYSSLFVYGTFTPVNEHQDLLAFIKTDPKTGAIAVTVANLSQSEVALPKVEGGSLGSMQPLMTNYAGVVAKSFKVKVEKRLLDGIIRRILTSSFHDS